MNEITKKKIEMIKAIKKRMRELGKRGRYPLRELTDSLQYDPQEVRQIVLALTNTLGR